MQKISFWLRVYLVPVKTYLEVSGKGRFRLARALDGFLGRLPVIDEGGVGVDDGTFCELDQKAEG